MYLKMCLSKTRLRLDYTMYEWSTSSPWTHGARCRSSSFFVPHRKHENFQCDEKNERTLGMGMGDGVGMVGKHSGVWHSASENDERATAETTNWTSANKRNDSNKNLYVRRTNGDNDVETDNMWYAGMVRTTNVGSTPFATGVTIHCNAHIIMYTACEWETRMRARTRF